MKSKRFRLPVLLLLLLALPLASCGTANLLRWGADEESIYTEPEGEVERGYLKPFVAFVGFPVALAWDVLFFPFQIIYGVYPYGDRFMVPEEVDGI